MTVLLDHRDTPYLRDLAAVRALSGNSGAQVFVVTRDRRHWFVRKAAAHADASPRLRRQMMRQEEFSRRVAGVVRTPRLLGDGEVDGHFYFDMEHIAALDAANYLRKASYPAVVNATDALCRYIESAAGLPPLESGEPSLFKALYSKVCRVQEQVPDIPAATLAPILLGLQKIHDWDECPTLCHGDLTLENILISPTGEIWVVDLLDSPFEHYWQDIAKLQQDITGGWYLRREAQIAPSVLAYVARRLHGVASRLSPRYGEVEALLLAITFLRILPYSRDPETARFVYERVAHFARLSAVGPSEATARSSP